MSSGTSFRRSSSRAEGGDPDALVDEAGRNRRVNENPAVVSEWFVKRLQIFKETLMAKGMQVKDYWMIFEWQGRGSIHSHGIIWLKGWRFAR